MMVAPCSPSARLDYMKSALSFLLSLAVALLMSSCSDDPVSSTAPHAIPAYTGEILSLDAYFEGVAGTAPNDVYAVGSVLLHYDGTEWGGVALPANAREIRAAFGFSDGTLMASDGSRAYLRKNNEWTEITPPRWGLRSLWGTSPADIYGIDYDGMTHFDGEVWTQVELPDYPEYPFPITGRSSTDIVTNGRWGAIYRFDGLQWTTTRVDSFYNYSALAITPSGRLFAGNSRVFEITGSSRQLILDNVFNSDVMLCADGEVLYAAGRLINSEYPEYQFSIQRYSNGIWEEVGKDTGRPRALLAGNGNIVAAGESNMIWRGTDHGGSLENVYPHLPFLTCAINIDGAIFAAGEGAYRYEDGVWTDLNKEYVSRNAAWAIAGRTRRDIYAVGERMIMHYDGDKWSWINGGFNLGLRAAWVDANGDLLTTGSNVIFRKHGDDWFEETIPGDPRVIYAMWGSDNAVYGVGSHGLTAVRKNGEWRAMQSATGSSLNTIWGFDDTHIYAAGENNDELCVYDGHTWQPVFITGAHLGSFQSIWGNSPADFWAAGYGGAVAHYDGSEWTALDRYFPGGTYAICGNLREALVLSNYGIISYHR